MKDQKPELEHIELCIAKTGEKLTVKVASFPEPIFPAGDIVHIVARVEDERNNLWNQSIAFYPNRMDADELETKCLEIVDNLEQYGTMLNLKK